MSVEKKVTPRPRLFPEGTAVGCYPLVTSNVERRDELVPVPDPTTTGVIKEGAVTFKGLTASAMYVMIGFVDEVQSIKVEAKKGKFKLKFEGQETAAIKFNATATEVKEALEALSNIAAGEVEVTGGPGSESGSTPYVVKFLGTLAGKDVAAITAVTTELEETPKTITISTTTAGSKAGTGGIQRDFMFQAPAE